MSDDTEEQSFKKSLNKITVYSRKRVTDKFISELEVGMRNRARYGYSYYRSEPLDHNICRDQLGAWAKEEKFILGNNNDGSFTIHW